MRENAAEQVTTPKNRNALATRNTSRMARKRRIDLCTNPNEQQMSKPTTTTTSKTTSTDAKAERCMRPGPLQRNPYLNFLREYRKANCGLSPVETIRRGAQAWKCLTEEQKAKYIVQAFYTRNRKNQLKNLNSFRRRRPRRGKSPARSKRTKRKARQANRSAK